MFAQKQNQDFLDYINKYADLAMEEMERAGVPASIKLAQGLLESNAGRSYLARKGNNHFGVKCGGNWSGKKVYREDDDFDENGKLIKSCFRSYRNVKSSYIAHSEFLRDPKKTRRYGFLFRLDPTDYRRWARGLKSAGYATSATYDKKLIKLIEQYELHKYDRGGVPRIDPNTDEILADRKKPRRNSSGSAAGVQSINDVRYLLALNNEKVMAVAERADISVNTLKKYNEKIKDANQRLSEGTRVFIQPKRSSYRGKRSEHKVETNQTLFDISQLYGIKLSKLYKRNLMKPGMEPAQGAILKLKGKAKKRPALNTDPPRDEEPELILEEPEVEVSQPKPETPSRPVPEVRDTPKPPVEEEPIIDPRDEMEFDEEEIEFEEIEFEDEETLDEIEAPIPPKEPFQPPKTETNPEPEVSEPVIETPVIEEPEVVTPPKDNLPANAVFYTVKSGDTLWGIARKFKSSVADLKRWNNLESDYIRRGMRFRVK